jgi:hypothetical protein
MNNNITQGQQKGNNNYQTISDQPLLPQEKVMNPQCKLIGLKNLFL